MSDASVQNCNGCNRPEYDCSCKKNTCSCCGCNLTNEELERETCSNCYVNKE